MSQNIFLDQRSFMTYFLQRPGPDTTALYQALVDEEYEELREARELLSAARLAGADETPAIVEIADACIDLIYVISGLMHSLGLDPQPLWNEVHRSNIDKIKHPCTACESTGTIERDDDERDPCPTCKGNGSLYEVRRRADGKVMKPEGWSPPALEPIVRAALSGVPK